MFQAKDAPGYRPAKITIIVLLLPGPVGHLLHLLLVQAAEQEEGGLRSAAGVPEARGGEFCDLTDLENPGAFVYSL